MGAPRREEGGTRSGPVLLSETSALVRRLAHVMAEGPEQHGWGHERSAHETSIDRPPWGSSGGSSVATA